MQVFKTYIENQQTKNSNYFYYHNTFSVKLTPHLLLMKLLHALFWYSQLYVASYLRFSNLLLISYYLFSLSFLFFLCSFFFFFQTNVFIYLIINFFLPLFYFSLALGLAQHCYSRSASKFNINIQPSIPLKILFDFSVKVLTDTNFIMAKNTFTNLLTYLTSPTSVRSQYQAAILHYSMFHVSCHSVSF